MVVFQSRGQDYYLSWNFMKPGSQSAAYDLKFKLGCILLENSQCLTLLTFELAGKVGSWSA